MLDTTAAWLAALIDGEGSVMFNRRTFSGNTPATTARGRGRSHYRPVVVVAATTDERLMSAIRERLGFGQVYEHRVSNTSKSHNPRKRRQWTYRLNVGQIPLVLPEVRPWMVLKGEQSDLLLEAMDIKRRLAPQKGQPWLPPLARAELTGRLDEIYEEIRALNTRGREVMPDVEQ